MKRLNNNNKKEKKKTALKTKPRITRKKIDRHKSKSFACKMAMKYVYLYIFFLTKAQVKKKIIAGSK